MKACPTVKEYLDSYRSLYTPLCGGGGGRSASMSKMEGLEHPVVETELRIYSHHTNEVLRPLNLPKIVFSIFTFYRPPVCNSYIFSQNNGVM